MPKFYHFFGLNFFPKWTEKFIFGEGSYMRESQKNYKKNGAWEVRRRHKRRKKGNVEGDPSNPVAAPRIAGGRRSQRYQV